MLVDTSISGLSFGGQLFLIYVNIFVAVENDRRALKGVLIKRRDNMLIIMKRRLFYSLDDASLIWTCIEPTIQQIQGKNFAVKSEVSTHLTAGQRALLMFQMLYGHTHNGVAEFYYHVSYLLSKKGVWSEMKNGMQYFRDYSMMQLLGEMEEVYHALEENNLKGSLELLDVNNLIKDSKLQEVISRHDKMLFEILPQTQKLVSAYIRNNPCEFVQFED